MALGAASLAALGAPQLGLVAALLLDLGSYQAIAASRAPAIPPATPRAIFEATPLAYQPVRRDRPHPEASGAAAERTRAAAAFVDALPAASSRYWITHQFTGQDPCWTPYYADMWMDRVYGLLSLEKRRSIDVSEPIGCGVPKLRVVTGAAIALDHKEAREALVAALTAPVPGAVRDVVLIPRGTPQPAVEPPNGAAGTAEVVRFTPNEIELRVRVDAPGGAWLLYADAIGRGWRAELDGRRTQMVLANLAFKGLRVPSGSHTVRFAYRHPAAHVAGRVLAAFGVFYGAGLVALVALAGARAPRSPTRR
ncbi:MAG: hypothetical protein DCC71_17175 [Proteobacteria bacterium]|nr:MAG: hypothetical protein DCC71_17175 [Pseudomonadota bacterium]